MTDAIDRMTKAPLLTRREEADLAHRYKRGDMRAKDRLVESNMRLVIAIATRFQGRGMELEDLVQEGTIGLIRTVEKFDPDKGFKFSTYASWWITHEIQRAVGKRGAAVKTPSKVHERRLRIENLLDESQTDPDGNRRRQNLSVEEIAKRLKYTPDQVKAALASGRVVASMDQDVGEDSRSRYEMIAAPEAEDLFADVRVLQAVGELPDDYRHVIEMRFGLGDYSAHTRRGVARSLGVKTSVVSSREGCALKALSEMLSDLAPEAA